jgi:hypothetical protein
LAFSSCLYYCMPILLAMQVHTFLITKIAPPLYDPLCVALNAIPGRCARVCFARHLLYNEQHMKDQVVVHGTRVSRRAYTYAVPHHSRRYYYTSIQSELLNQACCTYCCRYCVDSHDNKQTIVKQCRSMGLQWSVYMHAYSVVYHSVSPQYM